MNEEKVEISTTIIKKLFQMANLPLPQSYDDEEMLQCIYAIQSKIMNSQDITFEGNIEKEQSKNILIVDDIKLVTYQLKVLLKEQGFNVETTKDIFSAMSSFMKKNYLYLIMDLFVSTEQEGFTLLDEAKKIIVNNNLNTKIIVMTASNKVDNKVKCLNAGADVFIKKEAGWQDKIIEIVKNSTTDENPEETQNL